MKIYLSRFFKALDSKKNQYIGKNVIKAFGFVLIALFIVSCSEEENEPLEKGGSAPGLITNIQAKPLPGGAEISYALPDEKNFSYVEAEVYTPEGRTWNYKSSSYSSKIVVEGLATTSPQEVILYSVSKSGVRSEPTKITINPLTPAYISVFNSLEMISGFGGVKINYKNPTGADLAYFLGYIDKDGSFTDYDGYYSQNPTDTAYNYRGLPSEERKFALYIRDRWDNFSDTLLTTLTPLFEEEINKERFKDYRLANDGPFWEPGEQYYANIQTRFLWDGAWGKVWEPDGCYMVGTPYAYLNFAFNLPSDWVDPASLTIDLGAKHRLSRIRVNHYWRYTNTAAKKWEIWGCEDTPPMDGNWDWPGWIKIIEMEQTKPSGPTAGVYGAGDAEAYLAGTSADVDGVDDAIRYIRIVGIEAWNGSPNFSAAEITLYGQEVE